MSEFALSGSQTSFELPITDKENFLMKRYIWPVATLEGKDTPLGADNSLSVIYDHEGDPPAIVCTMRFSSDTTAQEAYDQTLQKWNELRAWMQGSLKRFWDMRTSWEPAIDNLVAALDLAPRFEEGGES